MSFPSGLRFPSPKSLHHKSSGQQSLKRSPGSVPMFRWRCLNVEKIKQGFPLKLFPVLSATSLPWISLFNTSIFTSIISMHPFLWFLKVFFFFCFNSLAYLQVIHVNTQCFQQRQEKKLQGKETLIIRRTADGDWNIPSELGSVG